MSIRLSVVFAAGQAGRRAHALAESAGGSVVHSAERYDGWRDLVHIEVPGTTEEEYLQSLLDEDDDVIEYSTVSSQRGGK